VGRLILFRRKRDEGEARMVRVERETRVSFDIAGFRWEVAAEAEAIRLTRQHMPRMPYTWPWWYLHRGPIPPYTTDSHSIVFVRGRLGEPGYSHVNVYPWAAVIPTIDGRGPWSLEEAQAVRRVMDDLRARGLKPYYDPENIEEIFSRNHRIVPRMERFYSLDEEAIESLYRRGVARAIAYEGVMHNRYAREDGLAVAIYEPMVYGYLDALLAGELDGYVSDLVGYVYGSLVTLNLVPRDMGVLEALEKNRYLRAAIPIIWWMISLLGNWGFIEIK
jgi:chorismate mutase